MCVGTFPINICCCSNEGCANEALYADYSISMKETIKRVTHKC